MNNSEQKYIMGAFQFKKTRLSPVSVVGFPFHHHCEETTNKTKSYNNLLACFLRVEDCTLTSGDKYYIWLQGRTSGSSEHGLWLKIVDQEKIENPANIKEISGENSEPIENTGLVNLTSYQVFLTRSLNKVKLVRSRRSSTGFAAVLGPGSNWQRVLSIIPWDR